VYRLEDGIHAILCRYTCGIFRRGLNLRKSLTRKQSVTFTKKARTQEGISGQYERGCDILGYAVVLGPVTAVTANFRRGY
jgi:hypothetical protein